MNPRIRPATDPDLPIIQQLAHEIWPRVYSSIISPEQMEYMLEAMYSIPSLQQQVANGNQFLLIEKTAERADGFAAYRPLSAQQWKLEKLYVQVDQHRSGLGRKLLERVMKEIVQAGGTRLELQVNRQNPAVGFYKRMGFDVVRDVDVEIGEGFYMNDHIMERILA